MKKKLMAVAITGSFLMGGGVAYAATNYYADLVTGQDQIKGELLELYNSELKRVSEQVHNDMVLHAGTQRDAMVKRVKSYLKEKMDKDQLDKMNEHTKEIDMAVNGLEIELKEYV